MIVQEEHPVPLLAHSSGVTIVAFGADFAGNAVQRLV
jgi:hypothetical protein